MRMFKRDMDMTGAFDASMESRLNGDDKEGEIRRVGVR